MITNVTITISVVPDVCPVVELPEVEPPDVLLPPVLLDDPLVNWPDVVPVELAVELPEEIAPVVNPPPVVELDPPVVYDPPVVKLVAEVVSFFCGVGVSALLY